MNKQNLKSAFEIWQSGGSPCIIVTSKDAESAAAEAEKVKKFLVELGYKESANHRIEVATVDELKPVGPFQTLWDELAEKLRLLRRRVK